MSLKVRLDLCRPDCCCFTFIADTQIWAWPGRRGSSRWVSVSWSVFWSPADCPKPFSLQFCPTPPLRPPLITVQRLPSGYSVLQRRGFNCDSFPSFQLSCRFTWQEPSSITAPLGGAQRSHAFTLCTPVPVSGQPPPHCTSHMVSFSFLSFNMNILTSVVFPNRSLVRMRSGQKPTCYISVWTCLAWGRWSGQLGRSPAADVLLIFY